MQDEAENKNDDDDDDEIAYFTVRWKRASFVYRTKNMR